MIEIILVRTKDGQLRSCTASGHAGYATKGFDIVCAGISSLLRTVQCLLESDAGISLVSDSPEPGSLAFQVQSCDGASKALSVHCCDFLRCGIKLVADEYPDYVSLRVETE